MPGEVPERRQPDVPADVELPESLRRRPSPFDYLEAAERQHREMQAAEKESWTPGQAFGVILDYLDRMEDFTGSRSSAQWAQSRMQELTEALHRSVERTVATLGLDPERLNGVFNALAKHNELLSTERSIAAPQVKAARDLIRLEISYAIPGR